MADTFTCAERSRIMAAVRSRGNKLTEVRLLHLFRRHGITGWRRHLPLPGSPDFTFGDRRVVVFVDGCFGMDARKQNQASWQEASVGILFVAH